MPNIFKMSLLMLFHPQDALDIIKRERKTLGFGRPFIIMLVFALINYLYVFYANYVLKSKDVTQANFILELAIAFLPMITWVVCAYAITSVIVGECAFKELMVASCYCLVPVIILKPLFGLLSLVLTTQEADIYNGLLFLMYAWMIILLILALQRLNDYSLAKTLCVVVISLIGAIILWAVILLIFTLFAQVVNFVKELIREFQLKY